MQQIRDTGISAELNWDLGFAKLTSITAWRDNTIVSGNDVDYTGIDIVQEPANQGNKTDFKQASEEIRLAGKSGALDWLVGGFFSSEILDRTRPFMPAAPSICTSAASRRLPSARTCPIFD